MVGPISRINADCHQRIEEMRVIIEDLEALKELNDELEEGHVETEKQLNDEIGKLISPHMPLLTFSDKLSGNLREERARSSDLDAVVLDMESTLNQFRDLVGNLQT